MTFLLLLGALVIVPSPASADDDGKGYVVTTEEGAERPPWSPPEGSYARYRYRYYPRHEVYFDQDRNLYFYFAAGRWNQAEQLPDKIMLTSRQYKWLYMNEATPWIFHDDVLRYYNTGFTRKYRSDYRFFYFDRDRRFRLDRTDEDFDPDTRKNQQRYWREQRPILEDNDDYRQEWLQENRRRYKPATPVAPATPPTGGKPSQ